MSVRTAGCLGFILVVGLAKSAPVHAAAQLLEQAETKTVIGEIVDPSLYVREGRHGPELVDQTYQAVDGGQTLALLDDTGTLYVLLAEEPGEDPNELVYDYVNQKVKVTGTFYERGGLRGVVVASVEPLEPPKPPASPSAAAGEEQR